VPGSAHWKPLVDLARRDVERGRVPACQVAVGRRGQLELFESLGDARPTTRFAAYSATKPLVAAALWHHLGAGGLALLAPVATVVPEFAGDGKAQVTVEQVLLHTSGFPSAPMAPEEGADPVRRRRRFSRWRLEWPPGSRFVYHPSSAHWVLADLLERLDGADFRDVVEQRVTAPLGLPRLLGIPRGDQDGIAPPTAVGSTPLAEDDPSASLASPGAVEAGVPGGGGIMTAADLALFYQALLHNPGELWEPAVLDDVRSHVRCTFTDPLMGVPVNRTAGLVVAGDDGQHVLRYACFGAANSPGAFGHAGAHAQVGWADPRTGVSFSYLHNALQPDMRRAGARAVALSSCAADLAASLS
jgi:CubicO group peptidase (beta-lactamase class C family)